MASLITCTPGGATDNCYVTTAQATAYHADTLRAATWAAWSTTDQEQALIQSTQEIEQLGGPKSSQTARRPLFLGAPYTDTQALHFPRGWDCTSAGVYFVPEQVQEAVCEQAYWLLSQRDNPDLVDLRGLVRDGATGATIDGASFQLRRSGIPDGIAPKAWRLIRPLIRHAFRSR